MADGSAEITPQAGDDIRSQLASALAASETKEPAEEPKAKSAVESESPAEGDAKPEIGDGKLETDGGDKPPAENAGDAKPAEAEGDAKPGADQKAAVEPPANWADADKQRFNKLAKGSPEDAQWLLDRHKAMEADYTRKTQKLADLDREFAPVQKLFEPHRDLMRQKGYTPESLIQGWYNVEKALMTGGDSALTAIQNIVRGYRVDPAALASRLGLGAPQDSGKPGEQQKELPPVAHDPRLDGVVNWIQTEEQRRVGAETSRVMQQIDEFKTAKDQAGNLAHPYFAEVEADMTVLSQATGIKDLNHLYDKAVWANTSTRQKLQADQTAAQEAQRKAAEEKKRAEDRAKAEAARKAAKSVTGAPGAGQPAPRRNTPERSLRETLVEAAEEISAA